MNIKSKTISIDLRVRLFAVLVGASILALGVYFYAVLATVHHAVAKENLTTEFNTLSVRVSELEYQGLAMRKTVDLDSALSQGFVEVRNPLYVSRTGGSLTLHTEGR